MNHALAEFWHTFDLILCINLKERVDRRQESEHMFRKFNIPVTYHETVRDPKGGVRGCCNEHIACIQKAFEQGCKEVVIFEDDADMISMPNINALHEVRDFLTKNDTWDLFFLGAWPDIFAKKTHLVSGFPNIRRVASKLGHAYIVSKRGIQKFHNLHYDTINEPIDHVYARNPNAYAIFPTWFYQTDSPSDLSADPRFNRQIRKAAVYIRSQYAQHVNVYLVPFVFALALGLLLLFLFLFFAVRAHKRRRQKLQAGSPATLALIKASVDRH